MSPTTEWAEVMHDGTIERKSGLMDSQAIDLAVGGEAKQVRSPWDATVFVSSLKASFNNWTATAVLRQSLAPGQSVHGTMVVLGPVDGEGNVTSITDDLYEAVMATVRQVRGEKAP
jgi:hypothetical protein